MAKKSGLDKFLSAQEESTMVAAYVLMQLGKTATEDTIEEVRALQCVKQAHIVFGPTDGIAYLEQVLDYAANWRVTRERWFAQCKAVD